MSQFDFPIIKLAIERYLNSVERKWWQFGSRKYSNEEKAYGITQLVNSFRVREDQ